MYKRADVQKSRCAKEPMYRRAIVQNMEVYFYATKKNSKYIENFFHRRGSGGSLIFLLVCAGNYSGMCDYDAGGRIFKMARNHRRLGDRTVVLHSPVGILAYLHPYRK